MKRDAYGEDGPVHKRQRQTDDEVTFLIPSKVAGSIIGKGGSNISKLRSEYKASITVPDCPGPERVLSISASDIDTILEIVKDILPNLVDGGLKGGNEDLDIRLLIHQSRAGCVIGKAGAKIKELREKTGARLKIFSSTAPQSTERVVQLVGGKEAVAAGVREVLDLIRQVPIKGAIQNYDPHNYDDYYAEEYGGFGGARPRRAPRRPAPEVRSTITAAPRAASADRPAPTSPDLTSPPATSAAASRATPPARRRARKLPYPKIWPARLSGKPGPAFERFARRAAPALRSRSRCRAPATASSPSPARRSAYRWRSTSCSRVFMRATQISVVATSNIPRILHYYFIK